MARKANTRYSREFKLEAVRLAETGDRPKAQIARELGIRVNQFRKWKLEFEKEQHAPIAKPAVVAEVDIDWLWRENARLREENELLKNRPTRLARPL
jgi:transposase-like protein